MLNKVKRILQWFIGGCYILSGLVYIGEYTVPAIILIILGGVIILPPITKRIPAFKFKKIALILLSSIVMIAGIQLGETNLSPEVLAKRKAESEAAAASQAALEAQEAAESASRAAEEEAASKAAQEKAESEAAVATENEIASMKAMILKDCNLSDIPRDDKNQMANADEKNFYAAWKEAAAEKIAEKNQGNNAEDLVRITFEQMVDFYKKIYPDSTLINTEKGFLRVLTVQVAKWKKQRRVTLVTPLKMLSCMRVNSTSIREWKPIMMIRCLEAFRKSWTPLIRARRLNGLPMMWII